MVPLSVLDLAPIVEGGTAAQAFRNSLDLAQHAERWGYRRYWLAEHHNMPGIASAATAVLIGQIGSGTSTIRIGAGGITLDAIEVTETGQRHPLYESAEIPLVKIATDDAHGPIHFGRAWVEVDAKRDRDAIIRAIRAGEFRLGFADH